MPLTTPPTAPSRADPSTFADRADAWLEWFEISAVPELNQLETDVDADKTAAAASASAAASSASAASTSATTASTQATNAATSASAAAASAASAVAAPGTSATSTTSLTIGTGSKTLTIETGKSLVVGASVKIARTSEPTKWMAGDVTAYTSGTGSLTVNVTTTNNSGGPYTDWTVSLSAALPSSAAITTSFLTQATGKLLGRTTAGTGAPEEITPSTSHFTFSGGSLALANPPGLVLVSTASASSSSTVDFTGLDSTYDEYELHILNAVPATDDVTAILRTSTDGSSYESGASTYAGQRFYSSAASAAITATNTHSIALAGGVSNTTANGGVSAVVRIVRPSGTTHNKGFFWTGGLYNVTDSAVEPTMGYAQRLSTAAITAVRFMFTSGNVASGEFKLYGVRKS